MNNANRIARLSEQEDHLLGQTEEAQCLLTAIVRHIEHHATGLSIAAARAVTLEAHRQFAKADRKLLKCRLEQIFERRARGLH